MNKMIMVYEVGGEDSSFSFLALSVIPTFRLHVLVIFFSFHRNFQLIVC